MWAKQKNGFTIVELLIVIVVIAILAAITIVAFGSIQQRARDNERSAELSSVQKALELYKTDFGAYPKCGSTGPNSPATYGTGTLDACLSDELVPTYMASMPVDPVNDGAKLVYRYANGYKKTSATTYDSSPTPASDNYIIGVKQETVTSPNYSGWGQTGLTILLGSG